MPLSTKGREVLTAIYDSFRAAFVEANPGCNENDVEREFLYLCPVYLCPACEGRSKIDALIESIR